MSSADSVNIGAFLAQQGLVNLGQFTGLAVGPGMLASAQGSNLALDVGPNPANLLVQNWFINALTGSDANDGQSALTPLRTFAALAAKWGIGSPILKGAPSSVISPIMLIAVNLLSDLPASDPLTVDVSLPPNTLLAFVGQATTVRTGILTAGTVAKNRATNTPQQLQDTVVPFTAADVGARIRITAGPNAGQFAWGAKDQGAGILRTSSFSTPTMTPTPDCLIQTGLTTGVVASGDPYAVETLTKLTLQRVNVSSPIGGSGVLPTVGFINCEFQNTGGFPAIIPLSSPSVQFNIKGCKFNGNLSVGPNIFRASVLNSFFSSNFSSLQIIGPAQVRGGLALGGGGVSVRGYAVSVLDDDFMVQGGNCQVQANGIQLGTVCAFDANGSGFDVGNAGIPCVAVCSTLNAGTHLLWGSGNSVAGVRCSGGSTLAYQTNVPVVTGVSDFALAGSATGSSFTNATGAISPATIPNTWANMAVPAPAGYGGNAHNFERNAHIVVRG